MITDDGQGLVGTTIYAPTNTDYPGWFVGRQWLVTRRPLSPADWPFAIERCFPEGRVVHAYVGGLYATLAEARADINSAVSTNTGREFGDDADIVETWV